MRTIFTRTLLVLGTLVCSTSLASAYDLGSSEMDRRFSGMSPYSSGATGVRQVAYLSDIESVEEQLPGGEAPMSEQMYEPMDGPQVGYPCHGDCCCEQGACTCCPNVACCDPQTGMYYAEAQLMFLRAHVLEDAVGKLSEKYEFTPRLVMGYEAASGLGARARYWTYGRTTPVLNNGDDLRLEFDVIDVEGTSRFRTDRADLVMACGFRWVNADVEVDDNEVSSDMPGITVAADVRTWLCKGCTSQWSGVAGARFSILGADWEGDGNNLIQETRDDNIVVTELYGGFEYLCHMCYYDLYARLVFETQNWHSDALGDNSATDSLGFIGPGFHVGATF